MSAIHVYYNAMTHSIEIDRGSKITTVVLDKTIDKIELAYVLHSNTLTQIIDQLTKY